MMKKITAFILSLVMIASMLSMPAYGFGYSSSGIDGGTVTTNEWVDDNQMTILGIAGIANGWDDVADMGNRANELVARWYFAHYVRQILKLQVETPAEFEAPFIDLTSEHQYYGDIKAVVDAGYMQGYPDGSFRANEAISTMEAASVMLKVLGYSPYIAVTNMQFVLNKTRILEDVPIVEEMNQAQMMRMMYNTLMSPAIRQTAYAMDAEDNILNIEYVIDPDYLGLEHFFGIIYARGIVDGILGTTLKKTNDSIKEGVVRIDGVEYDYEEDYLWVEPYTMLGYNVDFYYKMGADKRWTIVYMFVNEKNEEFVLTHDDILSFSNGIYRYEDKNSIKAISFTNTTSIIFNDVANPSYTDEEMNPKYGTVTFVDNNNDNEYDVVKVESFDFYFASSIDEDSTIIYDEKVKKSFVSLKDADEIAVFNGSSEIAFNRLKSGNMIVVKRSSPNSGYDKVYLEMVKVEQSNMQISAVRDEYFVCGGVTYNKWRELDDVELGKSYNLFKYGDVIVMAVEVEGGMKYGYLVAMNTEGDFGVYETQFKVVDKAGNTLILDAKQTVYVDGKPYKNVTAMETALNNGARQSNAYSDSYPIAQPIKYEIHTDGKLIRLDTVLPDVVVNPDTAFTSPDDDSQPLYYFYNNRSFYDNTTRLKNIAAFDSTQTTIMLVPKGVREVPEDFYTQDWMYQQVWNTIDLCDRDETGVPKMIYVYYDESVSTVNQEDAHFFIITDMYSEVDSATGDVNNYIKCYRGTIETLVKADEDIFNALSVGDVFKFEQDKKKFITNYQIAFDVDKDYSDFDSRRWFHTGQEIPYGEYRMWVYGTALSKSGTFLKVTQSMVDDTIGWNPESVVNPYFLTNATFWKYREVNGQPTVTQATLNDVATVEQVGEENKELASKVFLGCRGGTQIVYIIEK